MRWALDRYGIPYEEEAHAPPFHRLATRGCGPTVPALFQDGRGLGWERTLVRLLFPLLQAFREHPAGQFGLRIYRQER